MNTESVRTRQREVLDVVYRLGEASVADVRREFTEDLGYSAVRSALHALEQKNLVKHREKDLKYVYAPVVPRSRAARAAMKHLLTTYFDGDPAHALKALLDVVRHRRSVDYTAMKRMLEVTRKRAQSRQETPRS